MKLLCIDHFFEQDIEAMVASSGEHHCWSIPFQRFYRAAHRIFPEEVHTGIDAFFQPQYEQARREYAAAARAEVERLYKTYRFDAVLAPSDTFFWIRAVIDVLREMGIPVAVLQKEATIPPGWLEGPAKEWNEISPFIADHMLVSSENHRRFWLNGGVDPDIVAMTGQPRFDLYARPEQRRSWAQLGVDTGGKRTVLFLTYDCNAYLPIIDRTGHAPWLELRQETESVLLDVAERGLATVLVKAHPQAAEDQTEHLKSLSIRPGIVNLDPHIDVRHVIANADVVVGFQTTALMEALAAGRPTIYTWWTEPAHRYADDLIPFHSEREALTVADSPGELRDAIEAGLASEAGDAGIRSDQAMALVDLYLGPIDGRAGERCWQELTRLVDRQGRVTPVRQRLARRGRVARLAEAAAAAAAASVWALAMHASPVAYRLYRLLAGVRRGSKPIPADVFRRELDVRRRGARDRLTAATAA